MTKLSVGTSRIAAVNSAANPVAATSVRVERRRVIGRLQLTTRGLAVRDEGGLIWFLDVDSKPSGLLGTVVLAEGKRVGLTRLKVDYLGPSEGQGGSRRHSCRRPR